MTLAQSTCVGALKVHKCMHHNFLQLNEDKMEIILFGNKKREDQLLVPTWNPEF